MSNYPPPRLSAAQPVPAYPQAGYPPQQPRSGCGGCLGKFLIFLGIIFALIIAMCCGGIFYVRSYIASAITQQPAEVQTISDEIISIHVPASSGTRGWRPLPGADRRQDVGTRGRLFRQESQGHACFGFVWRGVWPAVQGPDSPGFGVGAIPEPTWRKGRESRGTQGCEDNQIERTIQGEKAVFDITEGTGVQSDKKKIRVQGAFQGKTGPAIFILDAEEETLSREKVEKMIDSME